jgi:3'-5' exoribonuclease
MICAHYRQAAPGLLNRDLCVVGAFLHDLGKLEEISSEPGFQYTDRGRLLGHILLGIELLDRAVAALDGFPATLADHLRHLLAAHHGELEHGSPKRPKTAEAFVVHRADELDGRLISLRDLLAQGSVPGWTPFVPLYDRYLWRGWPSGEGAPPEK